LLASTFVIEVKTTTEKKKRMEFVLLLLEIMESIFQQTKVPTTIFNILNLKRYSVLLQRFFSLL